MKARSSRLPGCATASERCAKSKFFVEFSRKLSRKAFAIAVNRSIDRIDRKPPWLPMDFDRAAHTAAIQAHTAALAAVDLAHEFFVFETLDDCWMTDQTKILQSGAGIAFPCSNRSIPTGPIAEFQSPLLRSWRSGCSES